MMVSKIFNGEEQIIAKCLMQDMIAIVDIRRKQSKERLSLSVPVLSDKSLKAACEGIIESIKFCDCSLAIDMYIETVANALSLLNKTSLDKELERVAKTICYFVEMFGKRYSRSDITVYDKAEGLLRAEIYKYDLYEDDDIYGEQYDENGNVLPKPYNKNYDNLAEYFSAFGKLGGVKIVELEEPTILCGYNNQSVSELDRLGYAMVKPFDKSSMVKGDLLTSKVFFNNIKNEGDFVLYFDSYEKGKMFADKLYEAGVLKKTDYVPQCNFSEIEFMNKEIKYWDTMIRRGRTNSSFFKIQTEFGDAFISVNQFDHYMSNPLNRISDLARI